MIEQIQEFVTDKASALTNQVEKIRKDSVETVREAVAGGADNLKALKSPVRVVARSGVKVTTVSQTAVASLIELQSDVLTSALTDVAVRLERAAKADSIVELVREQIELGQATRGRIVEDAQRAVAIIQVAGRDLKGVATHAYERFVETTEEKAPVVRTARAKTKRVARKTTRARKAA